MNADSVQTVVALLAWVFTGLLVLLVVTCVLARRDRIRANRAFGLKLPALLRSEAAWRAGHDAALAPAVMFAALGIVCSLLGTFASADFYWGAIAAFLIGVPWAMLMATRAAKAATEASR